MYYNTIKPLYEVDRQLYRNKKGILTEDEVLGRYNIVLTSTNGTIVINNYCGFCMKNGNWEYLEFRFSHMLE